MKIRYYPLRKIILVTLLVTFFGQTALPQMSATISPINATCYGYCDGSLTAYVSGGTPPYIYQWDDPTMQTGQTATNLCGGVYNVMIIDALSDTVVSSSTISEPPPVIGLLEYGHATCNGACDGWAILTPDPYYNATCYGWGVPECDPNYNHGTNLCAGNYIVFVQDSLTGCIDTALFTIEESLNAAIVVNQTDVTCYSYADGSIYIQTVSGLPPIMYEWYPPVGIDSLAEWLMPGTYNVTVTDQIGCTTVEEVIINQPQALNATIGMTNTISGACNGSVSANVTGGVLPYTYQWDAPQNPITATITDLCGGTYSVTTVDANGCTAIADITITNAIDSILINDTTITIVDTISSDLDSCVWNTSLPIDSAYVIDFYNNSANAYINWVIWQAGDSIYLPDVLFSYSTSGYNFLYLNLTCNTGSKQMTTALLFDLIDIPVYTLHKSLYFGNVKIYPSPFSISTSIDIGNMSGSPDLILLNSVGQEVRRLNLVNKTTEIYRDGLGNGVYYYILIHENSIRTRGKLIIY